MSHYSDVVVADGGVNLMGYWPLDSENGTADLADPFFLFGKRNPALPGIRPNNLGIGVPIGGAEGPGELNSTEFDGGDDFIVTGLHNHTNLVTNPSAETNTTGWAGQAGTLSRDTAKGQTGTCSFKIVSTSGAATTRLETTTHPAVTAGQPYVLAARVVGKTGEDIRAEIVWRSASADLAPTTTYTTAYTEAGGWQLITVVGFAPETAVAAKLRIYTLASTGAASDAGWVDTIHFEQNGMFEGAFDGSSIGNQGNWTGTAHASTSKWGPFVNGTTRTFEWFAYRDTQATAMAVMGTDVSLTTDFMMINLDVSGNVLFVPEVAQPVVQWDGWPLARWAYGMIVFNESSNTVNFYIDGAPHEDNPKTLATPWDAEPGYLQIGCKGSAPFTPDNANPFDGRIAHVAVYAGDQSTYAGRHAVLGLSELTKREPPGPWYQAG